MSGKKASEDTHEELDTIEQANGFHLEEAPVKGQFLTFLSEFGPEDVCICKLVPPDGITFYAIIKATKKPVRSNAEMEGVTREFLRGLGVINFVRCTVMAAGVVEINGYVRKAKSQSERLPIVRHRRKTKGSH